MSLGYRFLILLMAMLTTAVHLVKSFSVFPINTLKVSAVHGLDRCLHIRMPLSTRSLRSSWSLFTTDLYYRDPDWRVKLTFSVPTTTPVDAAKMPTLVKSAMSEIIEEYCARTVVGQDTVVYIGDDTFKASDVLTYVGVPFARTVSGDLDLKIGVGLGVMLRQEGDVFSRRTWELWKASTAYKIRMGVPPEEAQEILRVLDEYC